MSTLNIPVVGYHCAPSDVLGDHLRMLKGIVETIGSVINRESDCSDPENLAWTFILMGELIRHLEEDLEFVDTHYQKREDSPAKAQKPHSVKKKTPRKNNSKGTQPMLASSGVRNGHPKRRLS